MTSRLAAMLVLSGALAAGYAVTALFFARFWRVARDRLFGFFAAAFTLLALQRLSLSWALISQRDTTIYYALRLAAYLLILVAIVDKNRSARSEA